MSMYIYAANQSRERPASFKPRIAKILSVRSINVSNAEPKYRAPAPTPTSQQAGVIIVAALVLYCGPTAFMYYLEPLLNSTLPCRYTRLGLAIRPADSLADRWYSLLLIPF
jgi:hypothetical protein